MSRLEQLVRIILFMLGGAIGGDAFANSDMYQAAVGGAINIAVCAWWLYKDGKARS